MRTTELEQWFEENQYKERFLYIRAGHVHFFNVILCGITMPNPAYDISFDSGAPCYIFDYVKSGKGYLRYDGKTVPVTKGDLFFYPRGKVLQLYADKAEPYTKIWIQTSGKLMRHLCEAYGITDRVVIRKMDAQSYFDQITGVLAHTVPATLSHDMADLSVIVSSLLAELMRAELFGTDSGGDSALPIQIRSMLDASLYTPITLSDVAAQLHLSKAHIIRMFRATFGITPMKYLSVTRMEQAKILLRETNAPIGRIAEKLCYSDSQHFSSTFLRETGTTPTEYRKKERNLPK